MMSIGRATKFILACLALMLMVCALTNLRGVYHRPGENRSNNLYCENPQIEVSSYDSRIEAVFRIVNDTNDVVQITDIESGCGCAKPEVTNPKLNPGQTTQLKVAATMPAEGTKSVLLKAFTDHANTKQVDMRLTLVTQKQPPYILNVTGELVFDLDEKKQNGTFVVHSIIPMGSQDEPKLEYDNNQMRILKANRISQNNEELHSIYVQDIYSVELVNFESLQEYDSLVRIMEPWKVMEPRTIVVHANRKNAITVIPSKGTLTLKKDQVDGSASMFLVKSPSPLKEIISIGSDRMFQNEIVSNDASKLQKFRISSNKNKVIAPGIYSFNVKCENNASKLVSLEVIAND